MSAVDVARRRWAAALIRKARSPIPIYGSPEWLALPEGSAEKIASTVRAAECWAVDGDNLEEKLRRQIEDERRAHKHAEDEDYQRRAAEHRRTWKHLSAAPPPRYAGQQIRPLEEVGRAYMAERQGAPK